MYEPTETQPLCLAANMRQVRYKFVCVLTLRQNYPRGSDNCFSLGTHNMQDSVKRVFCRLSLSSSALQDVTTLEAIVKTWNLWQRIVNRAIQRPFLASKKVNVEIMTDVSEENITSNFRVKVINLVLTQCTATTCVNLRFLNLSKACIFLFGLIAIKGQSFSLTLNTPRGVL